MNELLDMMVQTDRPTAAGIILLAALLVQPVWFAAERLRDRPLWQRLGMGIAIAGAAAGLIWIPGAGFYSLGPLMALNLYLWLRHRRYEKEVRAIEEEIEKGFLSRSGREDIEAMIRDVEKASSAELRVLVELDHEGDPAERARDLYHRLGMDRTRDGTGVLFYFEVRQRRFAIWGSLPDSLAARAVQLGEEAFRQERFADGIVSMIGELLDHLAKQFPPRADNFNELPDHVIVIR